MATKKTKETKKPAPKKKTVPAKKDVEALYADPGYQELMAGACERTIAHVARLFARVYHVSDPKTLIRNAADRYARYEKGDFS